MTRPLSLLLVVLAASRCSDDAGGGPPLDGGSDAPVCTPPEVECDSGEYGAYGLCIPDTEELTVAAGSFEMGAPGGPDFPAHDVTLSEFAIDRTEVTNAQYAACVDAACCTPPAYDGSYSGRQPYFGNAEYADYPVIFVSWEQARQYCEGIGKRLPSEAEWEYAARGHDGRPYPWGTHPPTLDRANFDAPWLGDTDEVGTHAAGGSAFDAEDMAGNVWEWVNDWYGATYYADGPEEDPTGPETGDMRVVRGGSFASTETELLSYYRSMFMPNESYSNVGFRCAR